MRLAPVAILILAAALNDSGASFVLIGVLALLALSIAVVVERVRP